MTGTSGQTSTKFKDRILAAHAAMLDHENGTPSSLRELHASSIQSFDRLGFPTARSEEWKYTPISKWLDEDLDLRSADLPAPSKISVPEWLLEQDGYIAVCVDGILQPTLSRLPSSESEVVVQRLSEALSEYPEVVSAHLARYDRSENDVFSALNSAFVKEGLFVYVRRGNALDKPLFVTDIQTGDRSRLRQPRNLFVAEENSSATIIEWYEQGPTAQNLENTITEVFVGAGANVNHGHVFDRGSESSLVNSMYVHQERDSHFATNHITLTGSLVRHNLHFLPDAEGCETHLRGLVAARGNMHVDIHSFVDHAKPNSFSNELYKCILDGNSTGVFNGKVMVRQDAQLINAYQSNRSILLSDSARMFSKPELEIYADDVKCSHGATTGRLDDEAIFYLQSRGLRERDAKLLLLQSFAAEVLTEVGNDDITDRLLDRLKELLETGND